MNKLGYCSRCREKSVVVKVYGQERAEYCINKGCGYSLQLPALHLAMLVREIVVSERKEGDR